jgi:isoleucyl-tRNA synthetase
MQEGIARELVNRIQNLRKTSGYEITDKIHVEIMKMAEINEAVQSFSNYIASQTLANSIELVDHIDTPTALDFEDYIVNIRISKI